MEELNTVIHVINFASSMPPPVLLVWYDKVNYMYGSIERLFHASSRRYC